MEEQIEKNYFGVDYYGDLDKGILHLSTYEAVGKFKSIRRAIKRGHVSPLGFEYPKRPFSNKANNCKRKGHHSRNTNELKKRIYEQFKQGED